MTIPLEDRDRGGVLDVGSHFYGSSSQHGEEEAGATLLAHELEVGKAVLHYPDHLLGLLPL